jgi:hypothetical protein
MGRGIQIKDEEGAGEAPLAIVHLAGTLANVQATEACGLIDWQLPHP